MGKGVIGRGWDPQVFVRTQKLLRNFTLLLSVAVNVGGLAPLIFFHWGRSFFKVILDQRLSY